MVVVDCIASPLTHVIVNVDCICLLFHNFIFALWFRFTAEAEGVRLELVSIEEILDLQREEVLKKETEDKAKLKAMKDRGISSDPIQEDFFY